jgi:hypothetical protein
MDHNFDPNGNIIYAKGLDLTEIGRMYQLINSDRLLNDAQKCQIG